VFCSARLRIPAADSDLPSGFEMVRGDFEEDCFSVGYIVSYDYATINDTTRNFICDKLENGNIYSLGLGAIVEKNNGVCSFTNRSAVKATSTLCGRWYMQSIRVSGNDGTCPENYGRMTEKDGNDLWGFNKVVGHLESGESARFGYRASWTRDAVRDKKLWDPVHIKKTACAYPHYENLIIKPARGDNGCGQGKSLLTPEEVHANLPYFCDQAKESGRFHLARLAGGARFSYSWQSGCAITSVRSLPLDLAYCAFANRTLVV